MRRRVAVAAAGAVLALAYAGPAGASGEVLVSNTDSGFAENLATPLFDPACAGSRVTCGRRPSTSATTPPTRPG